MSRLLYVLVIACLLSVAGCVPLTATPPPAPEAAAVQPAAVQSAAPTTLVPSTPAPAAPSQPVSVKILAVNDFHGALDPSKGIGGAEYLATYLKNEAAQNPNTVKVSDGDMVGATPLLSALFHDEPTVMAFNLMGFDLSATGNHEYDEGWQELLRLQNGGCHPTDGCYKGVPQFTGATFKDLAANVARTDNGQNLFPPYMVREFGGIKVAFIGAALDSTPTIVVPSGVAGLKFTPEVDAINATVKTLKDTQGIQAFVVLLHDGAGAPKDPNGCNPADPWFKNVAMKLDPAVDVLITGHSHSAYNCEITLKDGQPPLLVTSAGNNGKYYTAIDLTLDPAKGDVAARKANNVTVDDTKVAPDAAVKALLDQYRAVSAPIANKPAGAITADITKAKNAAGESRLGDVIADAQLAVTAPAVAGGAVIGMTNPGGIRTDLTYASSPAGEGAGTVTYGEAFAVQPFSNNLVTLSLTGKQLKAVLEQQFTTKKMLEVSDGLTYTWSQSAPSGNQITDLKVKGVPVDPAATYRVTVNNFLADGGDGFTAFTEGTDRLTGMIDLDALVSYLGSHAPVAPGPMNRITLAQ
jgi:5'-nucleotidase